MDSTSNMSSNVSGSDALGGKQEEEEYEFMMSEYEKLGYLDIDELDVLANIADNQAVKLAYNTSLKLQKMKSLVKN